MKCPTCGAGNIDGSDACDSCHAPLTDMAEVSPKKGMEKRIIEGRIKDLSPKKALTVVPSDSLAKALELMRKNSVGCVLVVDKGSLSGILSERELLFKTNETTDPAKTKVSEVMRTHQTPLREDDEVGEVFHRLALSGHRHASIKFGDGSYGVVSARDLLRYLCK
jgi:CBS domain-containing protein